jgi:phosphatidylglycerophosphatase C
VSRTVAAFDFDGTLTRRDTLLPFLASVVGWPALARGLGSEAPALARMAAGRGDRDVTKERVLARALAGRLHADVAEAGVRYGEQLTANAITFEMRDRLAWHQREGHEIVIVSASLDVYLSEVARALAVEHVLCTALEQDDAGACTGRMLGGNCRGPEKAKRLRTHLGDDLDDVELWAYGNSGGDDEMLALAQHPVRVRRGRLRAGGRL